MDAFLPGVGDWQKVWLLRDKWHFNFYGETPEKLVKGRERIYLEHFWNGFAADSRAFDSRSRPPLPMPMPMLVLGGEKASREFLVTQGRLVASHVEGVVVPGAGHWLMEEALQATRDALTRFLNSPTP